jgi:hypothetical protein
VVPILLVIRVARVLQITPWKERVWGVVLFAEGRGKKTMIVGDGDTLAVGELFVEPRLACETATVLWLRKFDTNGLGETVGYVRTIVGGGDNVGGISDPDSTFEYAL